MKCPCGCEPKLRILRTRHDDDSPATMRQVRCDVCDFHGFSLEFIVADTQQDFVMYQDRQPVLTPLAKSCIEAAQRSFGQVYDLVKDHAARRAAARRAWLRRRKTSRGRHIGGAKPLRGIPCKGCALADTASRSCSLGLPEAFTAEAVGCAAFAAAASPQAEPGLASAAA